MAIGKSFGVVPSRQVMVGLVTLALLLVVVSPVGATGGNAPGAGGDRTVTDIEFLGEVTFPTGTLFSGTEVGGLSAIVYDPAQDVYYALSDDQSQIDPARYYTVSIDLSDGMLDDGDISFTDLTYLLTDDGALFEMGSLDPEGFTVAQPGVRFLSSEGNSLTPIDPFIKRYNPAGRVTATAPIPDYYLPDGSSLSGVRQNLAFESLTVTPNNRVLYSGLEGALFQDGPAADVGQESLARLLAYDLRTLDLLAEYVYVVEPVAEAPDPPGAFRVNGLVELLAFDNTGTMLAMERSFSVGKGNTVILYEVTTQEATDVSGIDDLFDEGSGTPAGFDPVGKRTLLDFGDVVGVVDNLEGMTFGPPLADGRHTLLVVSDNNFNPTQGTQYIALAVEIETAPGS